MYMYRVIATSRVDQYYPFISLFSLRVTRTSALVTTRHKSNSVTISLPHLYDVSAKRRLPLLPLSQADGAILLKQSRENHAKTSRVILTDSLRGPIEYVPYSTLIVCWIPTCCSLCLDAPTPTRSLTRANIRKQASYINNETELLKGETELLSSRLALSK